jgi:hypothetical protein
MSNEEVFGVIVLTAVFTSMFWGIIWSISTIDRLKSALYKREMND